MQISYQAGLKVSANTPQSNVIRPVVSQTEWNIQEGAFVTGLSRWLLRKIEPLRDPEPQGDAGCGHFVNREST